MQRRWVVAFMAAALVLGVAAGAWGATGVRKMVEVEYKGINIHVDGVRVATDAEPFLLVEKGRTFVPARPLAEAMGGKVSFDAATQTVQVVTPKYVHGVTTDMLTTWSVPYYGIRFSTPADLVQQSADNLLVSVAKPDGSLSISLARLPNDDSTPLATYYDAIAPMLTAKLGAATATRQNTLTIAGATAESTTTTHSTAGTTVTLQISLFRAGGQVWAFAILAPTTEWEGDQAIIKPIYGSVSFQ